MTFRIVLYKFAAFKISNSKPNMIIVNVKDNESVDRALKRFKKKFERTGVLKELRSRTFFQKPSITKRKQKQKAAYIQTLFASENY